jgi:hypothetical protein
VDQAVLQVVLGQSGDNCGKNENKNYPKDKNKKKTTKKNKVGTQNNFFGKHFNKQPSYDNVLT